MLSEGIATSRGRAGALVHRDAVNRRLRGRRGARLAALTSGGAIPDNANYDVVLEPEGTVIGNVDEDFAIESMAGDIILLGNTSWRIRRVETGARAGRGRGGRGAHDPVLAGRGAGPHARAVGRGGGAARGDRGRRGARRGRGDGIDDVVRARSPRRRAAARLRRGRARPRWAACPRQTRVIAERFFDDAGGMQLVIHAPFGGRINRAWGMALRKRFCRSFDFELQAAATDDGIVLSLGPQHSFPLETVFSMLRRATTSRSC